MQPAVPFAQWGLTAVFGMGTGVTPHAITTSNIGTLKRVHLFVAVRAAPCGVPSRYASVAVLPRLDLRPFERPGRAWQPSSYRLLQLR